MALLGPYIIRWNDTAQRYELRSRGRAALNLGSTAPPPPQTNPVPTGPSGSWSLVFQDEFSGTSLDTTRWKALTNSMNNVTTSASQVAVSGGYLQLTLSADATTGGYVSSAPSDGAGANGYMFAVGDYVEAKVFFPGAGSSTQDIYNWPAFWTSGPNWPTNGEYDIAEGLGGEMTSNYHYGTSSATEQISNKTIAGLWGNAFHVYGAHRKSNSIDIYYDGVIVRSYATNDLGGPHSVLINIGKSGSRTPITGIAGAVRVDYVRAWTPATAPAAITPNAPLTFTASVTGDTTASASWAAATVPTGGTAVTGYKVYTTLGALLGTFGNVTSGTLTGLDAGRTYALVVKATNAAGESAASPTQTITTTYTAPALTGGTITRRVSIPATEAQSATTIAVSKPTGLATGDVMVCSFAGSAISPPTITGGWTLAGYITQGRTVAVWVKVVTDATAEPASYTITGDTVTAARMSASIIAYVGVDNTTPLDIAAVTKSKPNGDIAGSTLDMTSVSTVTANAVLVEAVGGDFAGPNIIQEPVTMTRVFQTFGTGRRLTTADETRPTAGSTGLRSFTISDGGVQELDGVAIVLRPAPVVTGPTPSLLARMTGVGGRVATQTTNASTVRLKVGTDSAVTTGVSYSNSVTPDSSGWATTPAVSGLTAGQTYYYRVGMTNSSSVESFDTGTVGKFRVPPTGATSFAFNASSCCNAADSASMAAIAARADDLFFHLGDLWYNDGASTSVASYQTEMGNKIRVANHAAVFSTTSSVYGPSDHDFSMSNNGNGGTTTTGRDSFNTVYREMIPNVPVPTTTGIYHTFTWGRVRFVNLDTRSLASNPANTDNSSKTLLGSTQKQWLKDLITASTDGLIVLIGDGPWIGAAAAGGDDWTGFTTERTELANFFSASGKNICYVGGDMHAVAADDGTNSPGGIAVFHTSPLNNNSSIKGGPYTNGPYPASGSTVVQQYARFAVTDTGGSSISIAFTGYSSDNTSRVTLTKTYTVSGGPVTMGMSASGTTALSGTAAATGGGSGPVTRAVTASATEPTVGTAAVTLVAGTPSTTIAVVNTQSAEVAATGTTVAVNKPTGLANGHVMVATASFTGSSTITAPTGWTLVRQNNGVVSIGVWLKVVTDAASETATYTFSNTSAAGRISAQVTAFSGVNTTTPQDVASIGGSKANGTGNTVTLAGLTTVTAGALVLGVGGLESASTVVLVGPTEMTEVWHSSGTGRQHAFATEARATAGATGSRTWTEAAGNTLEMQAIMAALRPA